MERNNSCVCAGITSEDKLNPSSVICLNMTVFSRREAIYRIKKLILRLIARAYWRRSYIADIVDSIVRSRLLEFSI